jgi:hypothetical protein
MITRTCRPWLAAIVISLPGAAFAAGNVCDPPLEDPKSAG